MLDAVGLEILDERRVLRSFEALKIVPASHMTHQGRDVHCPQLVFGHREAHDRAVGRSQPLISELLVKRHIAVPVDVRNNASVASRGELLDFADDRLVVLMVEGGEFFDHIAFRNTLGQQISLRYLGGSAGVNVIGADDVWRCAAFVLGVVRIRFFSSLSLRTARPGTTSGTGYVR